jgi:hypothetical protein
VLTSNKKAKNKRHPLLIYKDGTIKTFIISCTFFFSFVSFGCTDFSGKYYNTDNDENDTFKMFQSGCESIVFDAFATKFNFDGKDQLFFEMGDSKVYLNNRFDSDKWILQSKTVTSLGNGSFEYDIIVTERSLNSDSDIVDIISYPDGRSEPRKVITRRVR